MSILLGLIIGIVLCGGVVVFLGRKTQEMIESVGTPVQITPISHTTSVAQLLAHPVYAPQVQAIVKAGNQARRATSVASITLQGTDKKIVYFFEDGDQARNLFAALVSAMESSKVEGEKTELVEKDPKYPVVRITYKFEALVLTFADSETPFVSHK